MSINRVNLSGNLVRHPDLRQTASGLPILSFSLAVNDRRKNAQTGEWEDYPNFIDCNLFGSRAEHVEKFLSKGTKVCLEGKLRWSTWERDGQKRSKIEVIVENIEPPFKDIEYEFDTNGEIHIKSILHGQSYTIAEGQRFAQMRLVQVPKAEFVQVESVGEIGEDRGGGFGSTGIG